MSSGPKSSAKPPPKTSNSYPNPLPPPLRSHPPAFTVNDKTSSNTFYDAQLAEWSARNARAKAIILSNLVPGSEPWQIAEPLEYAADIWKALEKKYGPKARGTDVNEFGTMHEESFEQNAEHGEDKLTGNRPRTEDCLSKETSGGQEEVADIWTHEQEKDAARSNAVKSQANEEKRKWNNDSMRDQQFLWALLNGGKEEELGHSDEVEDLKLGAAG